MVYDNPDLQFHDYAIIPQVNAPGVLLLAGVDGWILPHFTSGEQHFGEVAPVNRALRAQFGITVTTLRCVVHTVEQATNTLTRVYALDNHSPDWSPAPGADWIDRATLATLELALPEQRAVLDDWFDGLNDPPARRVPWSQPGWFDTAEAWIQAQLKKLKLTPTSPVEQLRAWVRSCTLRVTTSDGALYFKAVHPIFAYEPVLTRVLAQRYPAQTPQVVAVDVKNAWMLMRDFGGKPLNQCGDIAFWAAALRGFARLQVDMAGRTGSLIAIGCPDRHVDNLTGQMNRLLRDKVALSQNNQVDLSECEWETLKAFAPHLKTLCYDLLDYKIPLSLEHGDLRGGNIIVNGDQFITFDWSDSSVTHPFFDLIVFLADIENQFPDVPDARARLQTAYLSAWTAFEPPERLVKALELATPLAALHRALVCHQVIMPSIEARAQWELENWLAYYLRLAIKALQ